MYNDHTQDGKTEGCSATRADNGATAVSNVVNIPAGAILAAVKLISIIGAAIFLISLIATAAVSVACTRMMDSAHQQEIQMNDLRNQLAQDVYWKQRVSVRLEYFGLLPNSGQKPKSERSKK